MLVPENISVDYQPSDLLCVQSSLDIKEEAIDSRAEVKSFDHSKLKHVETSEKVTLPGAGG